MFDFDLNLLPLIIALHEERSVTRASRRLGISQPAASVALGKLRKVFGDQLFIKTSTGVAPTPRADSLLLVARDVLSRVERKMLSNSDFDPERTKAPFTFALTETGESAFLPTLVESLRTLAPGARIRSVFLPPSETGRGLEEGEIDLAIGSILELQKSNFFQQKLFDSDLVCVVRIDHPIRSERLTAQQYLGLDHVLVRTSWRTNEVLERSLGSAGAERSIVLVTSHSISLPRIIEHTDLVATVTRLVANDFLHGRAKLRIIEAPSKIPPIAINQLWHRRFHEDARNKWLRTLVKRLLPDQIRQRLQH